MKKSILYIVMSLLIKSNIYCNKNLYNLQYHDYDKKFNALTISKKVFFFENVAIIYIFT